VKVAKNMPARTQAECQERWHEILKSKNKKQWTACEDKKLIILKK